MIHTAIPDTIETENGEVLINFDKKRKEFEVLAQIKLLQGAANTYNLREDPHFDRWFASMLVLDEREAHTLSCQLETPPTTSSRSQIMNSSMKYHLSPSSSGNSSFIMLNDKSTTGHSKSDSIILNSSSGAGSQYYCELNSDYDVPLLATPHTSILSASSSVSNLSLDSSNSGGQKSVLVNSSYGNMSYANAAKSQINSEQQVPPVINAQLVPSSYSGQSKAPDFYIIRVTCESDDNSETDGIVLYRSIMLGNNERTPQVIRNALIKLGLEQDPKNYILAQVLPDKELVMPRDANVYYAVNTNYNLNFILRRRKKQKD